MREKEGYRDALERIRAFGFGEMLTVSQVAEIAFQNKPTIRSAKIRSTKTFSGWVGSGRGKTLPAVALARQMC